MTSAPPARHQAALAAIVVLVVSGSGCARPDFERVEIEDAPQPTASQRAEIEARVRECGLPIRNAKWLLIEGLGQWEFGFETDASLIVQPNEMTGCVSAISDELRLRDFRPPIIAYFGT